MEIRHAETKDVAQMMGIVHQAQSDLKKMNVDQWQNGYPNETVLLNDISIGIAYVLDHEGDVVGLMVCSANDESTYIPLTTWESNDYLVIHRFAVDKSVQRQGFATNMIHYAKEIAKKQGISSLRIDTHEKNVRMRRFLEKNQFEERGIIFLKDGSPRIAYELLF